MDDVLRWQMESVGRYEPDQNHLTVSSTVAE